jgi:beta-mannosidase
MGAVVWQLNDCWPVTSWAAVDGDGRAKPLLYAIQHGYRPRLVTIQPRESGLAAIVHNDSGDAWSGDLLLERRGFDGAVLASSTVPVAIAARGAQTVTIPVDVATASSESSELLVASLGSERALWFFVEYRDSALAPAQLETVVEPVETGYAVTVTAHTLVRDVALLVDRLDPAAVVDEQLVTLLPGESHTFTVATTAVIADERFADPTVLRSANQLLAVLAR